MKKTVLAMFLAVFAAALTSAEYISPEYQNIWTFAGKPLTLTDGKIKAEFTGEANVVLQPLKIKDNTHYLLSLKFVLSTGADLFFYVENNTDGVWQNTGRRLTGIDGKVQTVLVPFMYPQEIKTNSHSVFGLSGKGKIEIISYNLTETTTVKEEFINRDFENGDLGWELGKNSQIVKTANGNHVLEQWSKENGTIAYTVSAPVQISETQSYRLSYQVQGMEGHGNEALSHVFRVYPIDGRDTAITGTDKWIDCMSNQQTKYLEFRTPSRHEEIRFVVETNGPSRVQFDNFKLEAIAEKKQTAEIELDMPYNYRNGVFSTNPSKEITGQVNVHDAAVAKFKLVLTDAQGKQIWEKSYDAKANDKRFAVPAPPAEGSYLLELAALDKDGKNIHTQKVKLSNYPANPVEVTFNEEGITLLNGKPFFHIGHWWHTNRGDFGADMDFLREAGFNVLLMPNLTPERFQVLDLAQEHGMLGVIELPHHIYGNTPAEKEAFKNLWIGLIRQYQKHPALFAYFGPDEAMWGGLQLEPIKEVYDIVREVDPYHPLWYNEAPCGEVEQLREYAIPTCDVYGIDIYPIGAPHGTLTEDRSMTAVGKHTDRSHQAVNYQKPVWMILQGMAWAHIRPDTHTLPVDQVKDILYPTWEQTRFMTYNAIVHGATGVQYHYLGYTVHLPDQYWKDLRQVTLELEYMSPVFTAKTVREPALKCANPEIRFLTKQYQGKNYYLITNESPKDIRAEFSNCPESKLNVLFEDAPVKVANGKFSMQIPAYGVKVVSEAEFQKANVIYKPETYRPYSAPIKGDVRK